MHTNILLTTGALFFSATIALGQVNRLHTSASKPKSISSLPKHVVAPSGKLTLFADSTDVRDEGIVIYLVNRTKSPVQFESEDGDVYVRLEFKSDKGDWIRAQSHEYSWCANSYTKKNLSPEDYFSFLGYLPSKGPLKQVRYRRYAGRMELASNTFPGRVNLTEVENSRTDEMAIRTGDFKFLTGIINGSIQIPMTKDDWLKPRWLAIEALGQQRFTDEDVVPILTSVVESDPDSAAVEGAQRSLDQKRRRDNNAINTEPVQVK